MSKYFGMIHNKILFTKSFFFKEKSSVLNNCICSWGNLKLINGLFVFGKAATRPKHPPTNLALQHFDATYSAQLGQMWPSVRCALLSERKYGALFNNFSQDALLEDLEAQGCRDFISNMETEGGHASCFCIRAIFYERHWLLIIVIYC